MDLEDLEEESEKKAKYRSGGLKGLGIAQQSYRDDGLIQISTSEVEEDEDENDAVEEPPPDDEFGMKFMSHDGRINANAVLAGGISGMSISNYSQVSSSNVKRKN